MVDERIIIQQFMQFMSEQGVIPRDDFYPILDGKLHRFDVAEDKRGGKSGAYYIHADEYPNWGVMDYHKHSDFQKGKLDSSLLSKSERESYRDKEKLERTIAESRERQAKIQKERKEQEAQARANMSNEFFACCILPHEVKTHPYFEAKKITPEMLPSSIFSASFRVKDKPLSNEDFCKTGDLLIPLEHVEDSDSPALENRIRTLQRISGTPDDRGKYSRGFYKDTHYQGCYCPLIPDSLIQEMNQGYVFKNTVKYLYICEGVATGLSLLKLINNSAPVICAMSCTNMMAVAQSWRKKLDSRGEHKHIQIIIAADNDKAGLEKAEEVISERYAIGKLVPPTTGQDWNDYYINQQGGNQFMQDKNIQAQLNEIEMINYTTTDTLTQTTQTNESDNKQGIAGFHPYSHHSFADFCSKPAPIKYYIQGYIQETALHLLFGAPASGKSFLAVDMAASIACPDIHSWHDKPLKHGPVIYMAGEGAAGLRKRFAGWASKRNIDPHSVQLEVFDEVFHLDEDSEQYNITTTIENIKALYEKPALIVIDTLNVFMAGDENRAQDMGIMLSACRRLTHELNASVMLIHHSGVAHTAKDRARGSNALRGAMDIELMVEKDSSTITIKQTKNKEAQEEKELKMTLEQYNIPSWYDDLGYPVNTCTVEPYDYDSEGYSEPKTIKLTKAEQQAKETYIEAVKQHGERIRTETKEGKEEAFFAVEVNNWKEVAYAESHKDPANGARAREFSRGAEGLCDNKYLLIRIVGEKVYYCLDVTGPDNDFHLRVVCAIEKREKELKDSGTL